MFPLVLVLLACAADKGSSSGTDSGATAGADAGATTGGDSGGSDTGGGDTGGSDTGGGDTDGSDTGGADGGGDSGADTSWTPPHLQDDALVAFHLSEDRLSEGLLGQTVEPVGDLDGDGVADLALGSPRACHWSTCMDSGMTWLCSGTERGSVDADDCMGRVEGVTMDGHYGNPGSNVGKDVAGAGDLDGDGYDDVYVAVPGWDHSALEPGHLGIVFGPPDGVVGSDAFDHALSGPFGGSGFSFSVEAGGDVDGDGTADLLVGNGSENGLTGEGVPDPEWHPRLWIYDGRPAAGGVTTHDDDLRATLILSTYPRLLATCDFDADGLSDVAFADERQGSLVVLLAPFEDRDTDDDPALSVATEVDSRWLPDVLECGGDLDADGRPDLALGIPSHDRVESGEGLVGILTWETIGAGAGAGAALTALPDRIEGDSTGQRLGSGLAFVGDTDGDGHDTLLVGAEGAEDDITNSGAVYAWDGPRGVLGPADAHDAMHGPVRETWLGAGVDVLGDLDGDGISELALTAREPELVEAHDFGGVTYVHAGAAFGW